MLRELLEDGILAQNPGTRLTAMLFDGLPAVAQSFFVHNERHDGAADQTPAYNNHPSHCLELYTSAEGRRIPRLALAGKGRTPRLLERPLRHHPARI